jgi:hypothetical protein
VELAMSMLYFVPHVVHTAALLQTLQWSEHAWQTLLAKKNPSLQTVHTVSLLHDLQLSPHFAHVSFFLAGSASVLK